MSSLVASQEEEMLEYRRNIKTNVIYVAIEEILVGVNLCKAPYKDKLEALSFSNPLQWYANNLLTKISSNQKKACKSINWPSQHV